MKRRWILIAAALAGLAILVPLSSERPDSVQHILGMQGGVESALRAMFGIVVALAAMWVVAYLLSRKRPPTS